MTVRPSDPVVSGLPYAIRAVADRTPSGAADFVGDTEFTVTGPGGERRVCGCGTADGDTTVRFAEKHAAGADKDVRVWHISAAAGGGWVAEPVAVF